MAVDVHQFKADSSLLVSMLTPFFLKGKKVLGFLSAIAYPLNDVNLTFCNWARDRIIDAVTTTQPVILKWSLDMRFRKYFKDSNDRFDIIPYGYAHYTVIYETQYEMANDETAELVWMTEDTSETTEMTDDERMYVMDIDEVPRENDNFTIIAPPVNSLIDEREYVKRIKQVVRGYQVYKTSYVVYVKKPIS